MVKETEYMRISPLDHERFGLVSRSAEPRFSQGDLKGIKQDPVYVLEQRVTGLETLLREVLLQMHEGFSGMRRDVAQLKSDVSQRLDNGIYDLKEFIREEVSYIA
jgi:hypothetical protein